MQTILGAGGAIGKLLAKELTKYTKDIRLVSRNPKKVNDTDELRSADLLNTDEIIDAVDGSEVVYLTAGFPYDHKVWEESWPQCMHNVLEACYTHGSKLVFFDNIYMYAPETLNGMTEEAHHGPVSKKGKVRKQVLDMLWDYERQGKVKALVARSADFYGPGIHQNSMLTELITKPLLEGKKVNWICDPNKKHSFTYTLDAARDTALLGNSSKAFGDTWHLSTAPNPPTGNEWIQMVSKELGKVAKLQLLSGWLMRIIALFVPIMKEIHEMRYQYCDHYVFNSNKIQSKYGVQPTDYTEGLKKTLEVDRDIYTPK